MQKILMQGLDIDSLKDLRSQIESHLPCPILMAVNGREVHDLLSKNNFHLFIYNISHFSSEQCETIKIYRQLGLSAPALIAADSVQTPIFYDLREQYKLHWLPMPYPGNELVSLVKKLISARKLPQQMYRRFHTNQPAAIEPLMTTGSQAIQSSMYNLSKGGAYCEHGGPAQLGIGDLVRMRIALSDMHRDHTLNAKVVWTTKKGRFSGRTGLGLKFVTPADVHRYLMEKL